MFNIMEERQLILLGFGTATLACATIYYMMGKPNDNAATVVANTGENNSIIKKYLSSINIFSQKDNNSEIKEFEKRHHF